MDPKHGYIDADAGEEIISAAAVAAVCSYYDGWDLASAEPDGPWDLRCSNPKNGETAYVRIKARRDSALTVMLSPAEVMAAQKVAGWHLVVVTNALSDPIVHRFTAKELLAQTEAIVYRADLGLGPQTSA